MKNNELQAFHEGLQSVGELKGAIFAYAVGKNGKRIESTLLALNSSLKVGDEYRKFEKKKNEILLENSVKNEDGTSKIINMPGGAMSYEFEDQEKVEEEIKVLQDEYSDALDKQEINVEDFNKLMELESDVKIHQVKFENIPEDITGKQMAKILPMIIPQ